MKEVTNRDILKVLYEHTKPHRGLTVLILLSIIAGEIAMVIAPLYLKRLFDVLAESSVPASQETVTILTGTLLTISLIYGLSWLGYRVAIFLTAHYFPRIMADIEETGFNYLLGHSYRFFANNFAGSLVRKVRRLSRAFEAIADAIFWNFLPLLIVLTGSLFVIWMTSPLFALITIGWIILMVSGNYIFALWKLKFDIERAAQDSKVTGTMADSITNSNAIRLFAQHKAEKARFETVREKLKRMVTFAWNLNQINEAFQWGLFIIVEFVILYLAIQAWAEGWMTIGDFALLQAYLFTINRKIFDIGRVVRHVYEGFADGREMVTVLKQRHEIRNIRGAKELVIRRGAIAINKVKFRYTKKRQILDDLNLSIKPGEKIALVGPSGAGKSTVIKLLFRLFNLKEGKILIDNQDISKITQDSLRQQMSMVPQDPSLFHRDLMSNIRYGRPEASDKEVIEAAKKARCHEFIQELPHGYDTLVGERGIKLSGGERQRVAIARAILKDSPILILDEATSSLDSESESLIQEALEELMQEKTVIVIAHRLSTILKMDRIIVMDRGKVVDMGTHAQLKRKKGIYKRLWDIQAGGFIK